MTETTELRTATPQEPLSERVARRLRGCLAENRISQTDLAMALHMPQQKVSRKILGQTPLTLDEIELLAVTLGVELDAVLGVGQYADRGIGWVSIGQGRAEQRPAAPGGGQAFLPLGEGFGAPSGTRTPNPLIPRQREGSNVVRLVSGVSSRTRQALPDTRPSVVRTRHLRLVGQEAS